MANTRDIRRLAFQGLYQLDARPDEDADRVLDSTATDDDEGHKTDFSPADRRKAFALAKGAFAERSAADAFMLETAPTWPSYRQAAVDRAILRLAHYEMTRTDTPPKVVVNEAIELAKVFSTDKSAAFVNGLLDKLLKTLRKDEPEAPGAEAPAPDNPDAPPPPDAPPADTDAPPTT
jgi:N utilization substance protein B